MNDFFKNNWQYVVGVIVGLIVLVWIYNLIKKSGQKPHQVAPGSDIVGDEISQEDLNKLRALAELLHEDIYCVWCSRESELYNDLAILGNTSILQLSAIT